MRSNCRANNKLAAEVGENQEEIKKNGILNDGIMDKTLFHIPYSNIPVVFIQHSNF
jgi:hypothetical protein